MNALWTPQHYQKVLATGPITCWMLDEKAGTIAYDLVSGRVDGAMNGAHTAGVDHYQPGIGDGRPSSGYDGAADYTSVQTAALVAAFNGGEGTIMAWARVANAGVWTDGAQHDVFRFFVDADNYVQIFKAVANNRLGYYYEAATVVEFVPLDGLTTADWMQLAITWSASAGVNGEVRAYFNGAQTGATATALGVWAGNLTISLIGASNVGASNSWSGSLARFPVWDRPLSADEIADLYVVE